MVGKEDDKAQRVIAMVDEMRKNSQDMRQWKNIPLANECVQLLKEIDATWEGAGLWGCHQPIARV